MKHTGLPWSVGQMLSGQPAIDCEDYHLAAVHRIAEYGEADKGYDSVKTMMAFFAMAQDVSEAMEKAFNELDGE